MSRICTICARGGSKGVPAKNIRELVGRPLIAHSIVQARESGLFDAIAVSSDSEAILEAARQWGADYRIRRPDELASDTSAKVPAIRHCLEETERVSGTDPNMTRFLMSLEDSVDLVLYAFTHGQQGDIFVQKAPASTVGDLAQALKDLFGQPAKQTQVIGTRHGEKLYESLISREEMAHAIDMGGYYRIPADNRGLNYAKYFSEGETDISTLDDYTSHNTKRLNVEEVKSLLLTLDYIKDELHA